jgi:hypothetical protein
MQVIAPRFDGGSGPVLRNRTALETASKLTLRPDRAGLAASTPGSIAWATDPTLSRSWLV